MATFCTKCGQEIPQDKSFCPNCGTATHGPAQTQAAGIPAPPPESDSAIPRPKKLKTLLSDIPEREVKKKESFYEKDFESSDVPDRPDFEIKADQRNQSDIPEAADPFAPATPGAAPALSQPGILDRNPKLFLGICIAIAIIVAFPIIISLAVKHHREAENNALIKKYKATEAIKRETPQKNASCDIRLKQLYRLVQYQETSGTSLLDLKPGGCAPSGSVFFTDSISRGVLELPRENITISMNSLTKIFISTAGGKPVITLHNGEIWVDSRSAGAFGLNAPMKTAFGGMGKYHLLSANGRSYYTPVSGNLDFDTIKGRITVTPGYQLSAFNNSSTYSLKQIDPVAFAEWADWKDHIVPPKQKIRSASAGGVPATDTKDDSGIIDSFIRAYPYEVPKYVKASVLASTAQWAVIITKDTRPNPETVSEYWPQTASLLEYIDGHWVFLEDFDEYSKALSEKWLKKYNFTPKDEKALGLSY